MFVNPLVVIDFVQNTLLRVAICAELKDDKLNSVAMYVQKTPNDTPLRTTEEVLHKLFQVSLSPTKKPNVFALKFRPMTNPIVVEQIGQKFIVKYQFSKHQVLGILKTVSIFGVENPRSLLVTVRGMFRKTKDQTIEIEDEITCPMNFVDELYNFFIK